MVCSRTLLDGCSGAGSQLLQPVEDDGEERQGWRSERLLRVLTHTAAAAELGSHRPGPAAVSLISPHQHTAERVHIRYKTSTYLYTFSDIKIVCINYYTD